MKLKLITLIFIAMTNTNYATAQLTLTAIQSVEHQLDDVMEITDTSILKTKLVAVENAFTHEPNEINKLRLGIICHEIALHFSFLVKTVYKGYAQKSFDTLNEMFLQQETTVALMPFIASYRASALSLVGAETKKLKYLGQAFVLFNEAIKNYAAVSYLPEFLRGSVAENLPWFFFAKRKYAKHDFTAIIKKYELDKNYANNKIMSFTYWAWANQHQAKKYKSQAIQYLDKAILLDPNFKAANEKASNLKLKISRR